MWYFHSYLFIYCYFFNTEIAPSSQLAIIPRQLDAEASARIEQHKPARHVRARQSRSQVFHNSEDDAEEEEQVEDDNPRKCKSSPRCDSIELRLLIFISCVLYIYIIVICKGFGMDEFYFDK